MSMLWEKQRVPAGFWGKENQKKYMNWLADRLGFTSMEDWYKISKADFQKNRGNGLVNIYNNGSPSKAVESIFSDHKWHTFKFNCVPQGYWEDTKNQREYMEYLGDKLNFKSMEDWYSISVVDFKNNGGDGLLYGYYRDSPVKAVKSIFNEHKWQIFKFNAVPKGYWEDINNQREYMEYLGDKLNFKSMEDWYKISQHDIINNGGYGMIGKYYRDSPSKAVMSIFSEHKWEIFNFNMLPCGYWEEDKNQREYMEYLGGKLNFKSMEDWYEVSQADFENNAGGGLLGYYNGSPSRAVKSIFKDHKWQIFMFNSSPKGYWKNITNQMEYMEYLGDKLDFKSMEDWYKISQADFKNNGGDGVLSHYNHSPSKCVIKVFSDKKWLTWLFTKQKGSTNDPNYVSWMKKTVREWEFKLNIKEPKNWYRIGRGKIMDLQHGSRLIRDNGSLYKVLKLSNSKFNWKKQEFDKRRKILSQHLVRDYVVRLFPESADELKYNYKHEKIICPKGKKMELDIYIPSLNLAFEYNGTQHYMNTGFHFPFEKDRDVHKATECQKAGITLIIVPYWWNREIGSLMATILRSRPDLMSDPNVDENPNLTEVGDRFLFPKEFSGKKRISFQK